jgi:hypothetical protein
MPTNILQQVQTYQSSGLALLLNSFAFINKANKKFKDFDKIEANLGDTVTFDLPPRYITNSSLIANFQDSEQRVLSLTVDEAENVAFAFSAQQFIFNAEVYMEKFGKSAISELGTKIESNIASVAETSTYRFFGDGVNQIDSYEKLATALAFFRNYGAAPDNTCGFVDDIAVPSIIGTGLSEFALNRNNKDAMSWELGRFGNADWVQSNLLTTHIAGDEGQLGNTLTVTGVTTDADGGISAITVSGATGTTDSVKAYDLFQFQDGVSGQTDVRYRTFIGHQPSANPVQFQATADAIAAAGSVTIPISPKLYVAAGRNQNITTAIVAGMELKALPSHRCGLIYSGNALYLGMPKLPEEVPFPTASETDPDSGASLRMYYGSKFGLNEHGFVHDQIWGKSLVPEYSMRLVFPL